MKTTFFVLMILSLVSAQAAEPAKSSQGKSAKKALSKEALEKIESAEDGMAAVDDMKNSLEKFGRKRQLTCLKALGSVKFCTCLNNTLPIAVNFPAYVKILTSTKEEIGYETGSDSEKKVVDLTLAARETCVQGGY